MLQNKVALITGGTKGIGYGIAEKLIEQGMRVAITGRNASAARQVASTLGPEDQVLAIEAEISMPSQKVITRQFVPAPMYSTLLYSAVNPSI